jgi:hypothetical protein
LFGLAVGRELEARRGRSVVPADGTAAGWSSAPQGGTAAPFKATGAPACDRWTDDVAPRYSRLALVGTRGGYGTYGGTEHLAFSACARSWVGGLRWEGVTDLGNTRR